MTTLDPTLQATTGLLFWGICRSLWKRSKQDYQKSRLLKLPIHQYNSLLLLSPSLPIPSIIHPPNLGQCLKNLSQTSNVNPISSRLCNTAINIFDVKTVIPPEFSSTSPLPTHTHTSPISTLIIPYQLQIYIFIMSLNSFCLM